MARRRFLEPSTQEDTTGARTATLRDARRRSRCSAPTRTPRSST
uniref:Uncharacterized protein n=1 Tax=Arundo donax TaxID=35708 RepID=A0A0A9BCQ6_ARUDO